MANNSSLVSVTISLCVYSAALNYSVELLILFREVAAELVSRAAAAGLFSRSS
jgi:hypothetical protein